MPRWPDKMNKRALRVITCNLSEHHLELLDLIKHKGIAPSRSEGIRLALSHGLPILIKMLQKQERIINKVKTSRTPSTPSDKIFVENGDGTFQKYTLVGEA